MKRSVKNLLLTGLAASLSSLTVSAQTALNFGNLPLGFEAGHDRKDGGVEFVAHNGGGQFSVSTSGAEFSLLKKNGEHATVRMKFIGSNPDARLSGAAATSGRVNYLLGNDPAQWRSGLPTYGQVRCENLYPGINVVYYGNEKQLEYDFDLAAGVDPSEIVLRFDGSERLSITAQGELVVDANGGKIIQHTPLIYQKVGGRTQPIRGGYKILDRHTVTFLVGQHNPGLPLVIDPVLSYSTYFGGPLANFIWSAQVDGSSNVYIAGWTFSTQGGNGAPFATPGAFQTRYQHGNYLGDGFVAKFNSAGSNVWTTYLGGANGDNLVSSLALDSAGNVYLTGYTTSTSFPTTNSFYPTTGVPGIQNSLHISGSFDKNLNNYPADAFVAELDNSGSNLLFSTYLGGSELDGGYGIAVDAATNIYVTGYTSSTDFPVTTNALFKSLQCTNTGYYNFNAFVTEIAAGGAKLNYSTYFGGANLDWATTMAYTNGYLLIAGYTASANLFTTNVLTNQVLADYTVTNQVGTNTVITTNNYYFNSQALNGSPGWYNNSAIDAFVACFTNTGTALTPLYSTYLGGTNDDFANGIAADGNGDAYVVGQTISTNFPYFTPGIPASSNLVSYIRTNVVFNGFGATNAFLTRIDWNGTNASIGYSVMFGGLGIDVASAVALAPDGNLFVDGYASSTTFPVTTNNLYGSLKTFNSGNSDAFVMAFSNRAPVLLYSAYLGGGSDDFAYAIGVDAADSAYVVGQTGSTGFPIFDASQSFLSGSQDIFLTKILLPTPVLTLAANPTGTNVVVSWTPIGQATTNLVGLQTTTNLASTNWTPVSQVPTLTTNLATNVYDYEFSTTNQMQFFRLHKF